MINNVKRVKDFNIQYVSGVWGDYSSEENDDGIFVLRSTEQKLNGELNIINPAYVKVDYKPKNILREGDLLITKSSGSKSHVGKCSYISKEIASCKYAFSNFMIGIRVKDKKLDPEYLYFCINSKLIKRQIERNSMSVTLNNLNQNNISNWFIPFSNIDIQKNIVNFLKNEIKIIDKKLKKYNKKIDLLKKYKEALIYETVTKGLDKNVEMKDSGINSIGEYPVKWELKRIKDLFKIGRGRVIATSDVNEKDINNKYPVYSAATVNEGIIGYLSTFDFSSELITWTTDGAKAGTVFLRKGTFNCTNVCGTLKLKKIYNIAFFKYALSIQTPYYKRADINGAKIMNNEMGRIKIVFPKDINKQNEIVNFLDKKTKEIDSEVEKLSKKIGLIEELKESIIYECVTGKLDIEVDGEKYQKIIESI